MHTILLRIDEDLNEAGMRALQADLRNVGHVTDVEFNTRTPHDLLVEFEEEHVSSMMILGEVGKHGFHADIMSG
jgi:hypothetical protein